MIKNRYIRIFISGITLSAFLFQNTVTANSFSNLQTPSRFNGIVAGQTDYELAIRTEFLAHVALFGGFERCNVPLTKVLDNGARIDILLNAKDRDTEPGKVMVSCRLSQEGTTSEYRIVVDPGDNTFLVRRIGPALPVSPRHANHNSINFTALYGGTRPIMPVIDDPDCLPGGEYYRTALEGEGHNGAGFQGINAIVKKVLEEERMSVLDAPITVEKIDQNPVVTAQLTSPGNFIPGIAVNEAFVSLIAFQLKNRYDSINLVDPYTKKRSDVVTSEIYSVAIHEIRAHLKQHLPELQAQSERGRSYRDINIAAMVYYWSLSIPTDDRHELLEAIRQFLDDNPHLCPAGLSHHYHNFVDEIEVQRTHKRVSRPRRYAFVGAVRHIEASHIEPETEQGRDRAYDDGDEENGTDDTRARREDQPRGTERYLQASAVCDKDNIQIFRKARSITRRRQADAEKAKVLWAWIRKVVRYGVGDGAYWDAPSSETLQLRHGSLFNIANLMVSLTRSLGIPARFGVIKVDRELLKDLVPPSMFEKMGALEDHVVAEVLLEDKWVSFDILHRAREDKVFAMANPDKFCLRHAKKAKREEYDQLEAKRRRIMVQQGGDEFITIRQIERGVIVRRAKERLIKKGIKPLLTRIEREITFMNQENRDIEPLSEKQVYITAQLNGILIPARRVDRDKRIQEILTITRVFLEENKKRPVLSDVVKGINDVYGYQETNYALLRQWILDNKFFYDKLGIDKTDWEKYTKDFLRELKQAIKLLRGELKRRPTPREVVERYNREHPKRNVPLTTPNLDQWLYHHGYDKRVLGIGSGRNVINEKKRLAEMKRLSQRYRTRHKVRSAPLGEIVRMMRRAHPNDKNITYTNVWDWLDRRKGRINLKNLRISMPKKEARVRSRGDGFIVSHSGNAPLELQALMAKPLPGSAGRVKVKLKNFDRVVDYIRSRISVLETRAGEAKDEWSKKRLPVYAAQAREALEHLIRLNESGKIFAFDAIVYSKEDYALGSGNNKMMFICRESRRLPLALFSEYIFHEALCFKGKHYDAISIQSELFTENHAGDDDHRNINRLKAALRGMIDRKACIKGDIDYRHSIKSVLAGIPDTYPIFTDIGDHPATDREGFYPGEPTRRWEDTLKNMFVSGKTCVFYGQFKAIRNVTNDCDRYSRKIEEKNNFKVALDPIHGLAGVWDVSARLNEHIKNIMQGRTGPVLVDLNDFVALADLFGRGYTKAGDILRRLVERQEPAMNYEDFESIVQMFAEANKKGYEEEREMEQERDTIEEDARRSHVVKEHFIREQLRRDAEGIHEIIDLLSNEDRMDYVKRYLVSTDLEIPDVLGIMDMIFHEDKPRKRLMWDIYMDTTNTPSEDAKLRDLIVAAENPVHGDYGDVDILYRIYHTFKERDITTTNKALEVLLRLKIEPSAQNTLFRLLETAYYKADIVSAFCLLHPAVFGVEDRPVVSAMYRRAFRSPVDQCFSPDTKPVYFYLAKITEAWQRGGNLRSDVDNRLLYHTVILDGGASLPGYNGRTWFTQLRSQVHTRASKQDLDTVRTMLYYWKELDPGISRNSTNGLVHNAMENISEQDHMMYSCGLNRFLEYLKKQGRIVSLENDDFLNEILSIPEEELIEMLHTAVSAPTVPEYILDKLEHMFRLYYALNERYGVVSATLIPNIKNNIYIAGFMKEDRDRLLAVIDSDNYAEILPALAQCRLRIKNHLLFDKREVKDDEEPGTEELLELDSYMAEFGKELMGRVLEDIAQCERIEDLAIHVPTIMAIGKFLIASGLGGVDFEQFVHELEHGRITYSQLHDLTRALSAELHKINRHLNDTVRLGAGHVFEHTSHEFFIERWGDKVTITPAGEGWNRPLSQESREAIIGTIVDNLIRDSGLLLFDQVLMRFNEILEKQVTPAND
ncbi:MAG: transglutaminase-like domain-containing protein, partial [Candidatus Omnitrophica bacterium]|nr:transglutaminase-like domain-containing protein [Candidatus Omnitrophota bacterium]